MRRQACARAAAAAAAVVVGGGVVLTMMTMMTTMVVRSFILTLNCGLEYEKSEVNAAMMYKTAAERQAMAEHEHSFVDKRVAAIIKLKNEACSGDKANYGFMVVNQKVAGAPTD